MYDFVARRWNSIMTAHPSPRLTTFAKLVEMLIQPSQRPNRAEAESDI